MVLDTDAHQPSDLVTRQQAIKVALGAGLNEADFEQMQKNAESFLVTS
jgi:histidinol phosphatase-like PHP family hydrolase